jgi:outer membrane protein insertion porin family/translocation and assembly module TamA
MIKRTLRLVGAATLIAAPAALGAQDPTRCAGAPATQREVTRLSFDGNSFYGRAFLANGIITEASSWTRRYFRVLGTRRCLDQKSFEDDVRRIIKVYHQSGFAAVKVDTSVRAASHGRVEVAFTIHEGEPTIVDSLRITGLDSVPERAEVLKHLPLVQGGNFDQYTLRGSIDSITFRLRDRGYPAADVFPATHAYNDRRRATVELAVEPGRRARLDSIDIVISPLPGKPPAIPASTVQRLIGVKPGDLYRESRLQRAKRNMYSTESYRAVTVDVDSSDVVPPGDSLVTIHVNLSEGLMHSARMSGGWGSLDCFRAEGEYRDNNFRSSARTFETRLRLSKIGIGRPLAGAAALCPNLRSDPYSSELNYYLGFTLSDPKTWILGFRPSVTLFSERRSEYKAFLRSTPIGALLSASRQSAHAKQTLGYQAEYRKTEAQPAIFCALQNICLPEDRDPLLAYRRLGTVSWAVEQNWSNDPQYPTSGGGARVELRHASTVTGSDPQLQFSKATADLSVFFDLGRGIVFAPRLRVGAVVGPSFTGTSKFIPPEERIFAGGPNTVRGFDQNDLGPKVYIARGYDTVRAGATAPTEPGETFLPGDTVFFRTRNGVAADRSVPTGGSALIVGNAEVRIPSPFWSRSLQLALFVDAGELWSPGAPQAQDKFRNIKVTPGFGIRVLTPIGAIRADVAYNQYAPRLGAAFFDTPVSQGGQLYCVSPGNMLAVTNLGATNGNVPTQVSGSCVAGFRPPAPTAFLRRLNLSFGIGQAY